MTAVFDNLEEIKRKTALANEELKRMEGMSAQVRKDRKKGFGVSSLKAAEKKLSRLGAVERKRVREYTRELKKWEKDSGPTLSKLLKKRKQDG